MNYHVEAPFENSLQMLNVTPKNLFIYLLSVLGRLGEVLLPNALELGLPKCNITSIS